MSMTFKENLQKFLNEEEISSLLDSLSLEDEHAVLLNTKKMSNEEFLSLFPNVTAHPITKNAYIYNKNEYQLGKSLYHELGCFYLQDPSAMSIASLLPKLDNAFILDMCAAPGGKSIQTSFLNEDSTIISNDLSRSRCDILLSNIERLGISNVIICNNDFAKIYHSYDSYFDMVILDAPCSGSGMFRKDDKMIEDWSINKVYKFAQTQKELIDIAYQMLKPGGYISYSTCSYSMEEDEEVILSLLNKYDDIEVVPLDIKDTYINPKCPIGYRFMPNIFKGEGQYFCLLKKKGDRNISKYKNENKYQKDLPFIKEDINVNKYGDVYFGLNKNILAKPLNVIRYGVKICEYDKKVYRFDLHFARSEWSTTLPIIELDENEVKKYLGGNQLDKANDKKGYILLTYKNKSIDIAKTDGRVIKNHYPKGLRKLY